MAEQSEGSSSVSKEEILRQLKQNYRRLGDTLVERREELTEPESNALDETLDKTDALYAEVRKEKRSHEAGLDSEVFKTITERINEKTRKFHTGSKSYTAHGFLAALSTKFGQGDSREESPGVIRWTDLGIAMRKYLHTTPTVSFMLGPLDVQPKERKTRGPRAARVQLDNANVTRPEEVKDGQGSSKGQTERRLQTMYDTLIEAKETRPDGLSVVECVVNPQSFSQTVENLFDLSFLVKDGKAGVFNRPDQLPAVEMREPASTADYARGVREHQCVVKFDMAMWQDLIHSFTVQSCIIPDRSPSTSAAAAAPSSSSSRPSTSSASSSRAPRPPPASSSSPSRPSRSQSAVPDPQVPMGPPPPPASAQSGGHLRKRPLDPPPPQRSDENDRNRPNIHLPVPLPT